MQFKAEKDNILIAIDFICEVAKNYYYVPGYVEKWVFIIDVNETGVTNFPFNVRIYINLSM